MQLLSFRQGKYILQVNMVADVLEGSSKKVLRGTEATLESAFSFSFFLAWKMYTILK